jgi:hypothetical protein
VVWGIVVGIVVVLFVVVIVVVVPLVVVGVVVLVLVVVVLSDLIQRKIIWGPPDPSTWENRSIPERVYSKYPGACW